MVENEVNGFTDTFQEINSTMAELAAGSSDIVHAVSALNSVTFEIKTASNEINNGAVNVGRSMSSIKQLSDSVLTEIQDVGTRVFEITESIGRLHDISLKSKEATSSVKHSMQQFHV